jgi:hypothetical protein
MLIAQDEEGWRNMYVQSAQEMEKRYSEGSPHFSCSLSTILCAQSTIVPLNGSGIVFELGCIQSESFGKLCNPSYDGFL